jgi:hypothetical protein
MDIITRDLYEGCLLEHGWSRPAKSTMVHLFPLHQIHPLCGTFASGAIFSADDACVGNPRCKSGRKYARHRYTGVF